MNSMKKHITTALTATILSAALTVPATAAEIPVIRMSSYKGNSLEAGERSFLTIGPARAEDTASSGQLEIVAVEPC